MKLITTDNFFVTCEKHNYHSHRLFEGTAIIAAQMHSLLPCDEIKVFNKDGLQIEWREECQLKKS